MKLIALLLFIMIVLTLINGLVFMKKLIKLQEENKIINQSKNRLIGDVYLLSNNITTNEYIQVLKHIVPTYFDIIKIIFLFENNFFCYFNTFNCNTNYLKSRDV